MREIRLIVSTLVVLVAVAAVTPAGAVQSTPDADNTVTRIDVRADGDARWSVVVRTRLHTDSEMRDYRSFQRRFRENRSQYLGPFRDRIESVVAATANETGRPMRAANFSASTSVQQLPRRWGVVIYEFTWTEFARTDGRALIVGDVFAGGFYIDRNDTLALSAPESYAVTASAPAPDSTDDGTLTWTGRRDFTDGHPSARFEPVTGTPPAAGEKTENGGGGPAGRVGPATIGVIVVGVLVLLGGGYRLYDFDDDDEPAAADPVVTDAEQVERLLAEHGGRLKQSTIADELEWSPSKTSRVVSGMAESGRLEKLRIGRENVITLVDEE